MAIKAETRKLARDLLNLALSMQNEGYQVFFSWQPHVDWIEIQVYEPNWAMRKDPIYKCLSHTNDHSCDRNLRTMIAKLEELRDSQKGETSNED